MTEEPATQRSLARRSEWLLAPVLAAIHPVLSLYAESIAEANVRDVIICAAVVIIASVALAYALRVAFGSAIRASLAAVVVVAWTFMFGGYLRVGRIVVQSISSSPALEYALPVIWLAVLLACLYLLYRLRATEERLEQLYGFVSLACLFAVGFAAFQGAAAYFTLDRIREPVASIWGDNQDAVPANWKPQMPNQPRDIYYLVFDRYGNSNTLQKFFGFDNTPFYEELEKRGFIVEREATTSYPMTVLAMSSALNMRYLGPHFANIADYFQAIQQNEVGKLFVEAGYQYHYFGNYYAPLRKNDSAQWNLRISTLPCEFADSLVNMTPLRPLIGRNYKHRFVADKFAKLAELASDPEITFAYAHFLVPHPPYVFARDGSALSEWSRATLSEQKLYTDQLVATNAMILKLVDRLLNESKVPPIIILQSDEGPYLMAGDESLPEDEQIAKRTGILNAFYIPDADVRQRLPKPLMPVNTFRFVFKEYFDAPIELLPNRTFYWESPSPYGIANPGSRIVDVTADSAIGQ